MIRRLVPLVLLASCATSETELQTLQAEVEKCQADLQGAKRQGQTREGDLQGQIRKTHARVLEMQQRQEVFTRGFKNDPLVLDKLLGLLSASVKRSEELETIRKRLAPQLEAGRVRVLVERSLVVLRLDGGKLFDGADALSKDAVLVIGEVASALRELPNRDYLVADHAGPRPSGERGKGSSFERSAGRAAAVAAALSGKGVPPDRIAIAGHSEFAALGAPGGSRLDIWLLPSAEEVAPIDRRPEAPAVKKPAEPPAPKKPADPPPKTP